MLMLVLMLMLMLMRRQATIHQTRLSPGPHCGGHEAIGAIRRILLHSGIPDALPVNGGQWGDWRLTELCIDAIPTLHIVLQRIVELRRRRACQVAERHHVAAIVVQRRQIRNLCRCRAAVVQLILHPMLLLLLQLATARRASQLAEITTSCKFVIIIVIVTAIAVTRGGCSRC